MEMRSLENIQGIGVDLTPQLPPIAFSLSDTFLHSHCSSCFDPLLPSSSTHHHLLPTPIHYCSLPCSQLDSPLHFASAEHHLFLTLQSHPTTYWHDDTSDLRTALRLLHQFTHLGLLTSPHSSRIGGLLTNHEKLKQHDDEELLARIREGGRFMSLARRMRDDGIGEFEENCEVEEMVLCIVMTNAVEVRVNDEQGGGVAVYGPCFSWINHSCTPNACYRFTLPGSKSSNSEVESRTRITSFGDELGERINGNGLGGCGPRIVVRSIKPIKKGEEVCVAYTDLLQPKATRNLELFSRYSFICCCRRCSASPPTYVDSVLHGKSAANIERTNSSWDEDFCKYDAYEELSDCMDDIISEYLSIGNPESCCKKLESILFRSQRKEQSQPEQFQSTFNLHPLHHLSVNAYITLASAYKIRASELLASPSALDVHRLEAFNLSRTSAAYSLLLAGAAHHLFLFEPSLIVSAVHFWVSAGESLLFLVRSIRWYSIKSQRYPNSSIFHIPHHICEQQGRCSLVERLEAIMDCPRSQSITSEIEFQEISKGFFYCASRLSSKIWPFLCQSMHYFGDIKDPIDFSWLEPADSTLGVSHDLASSTCANGGCSETQNNNDDTSENVLQLGVHCLLYGEYLGSICYSYPNHLTNHVRSLLEVSNIYQKNCNVTSFTMKELHTGDE